MKRSGRKKYFFDIFKTKSGYMAAVKSSKGIYSIILPKKTRIEVDCLLGTSFRMLIKRSTSFKGLKQRLRAYFRKKPVHMSFRLDLTGYSDFDKKVFAAVRTIPAGQTRSYSWVAKAVGGSKLSRAVGQALSRNRLPILIPCHRVLGKSDLGGFSFGIENKRLLLQAEGRLW